MKKLTLLMLGAITFITLTSESGCQQQAVSSSGAQKAETQIKTDINGYTIEQNNIIARLQEDNKPGSIKHLYIMSAYSGQVVIYSTVKGKVTSSGKRLSPSRVIGVGPSEGGASTHGFQFAIPSGYAYTDEMMGDDGTYGGSSEFIFWFDSKGIYHQQYVTGGMIVHVSSEPIAVKSVILNLETSNTTEK